MLLAEACEAAGDGIEETPRPTIVRSLKQQRKLIVEVFREIDTGRPALLTAR
jgi:hypothetical protein